MDPLIITAAITGAETRKEDQPALPITAKEQAESAYECVENGARVIHLHVRDSEGNPSQSLELFEASISAIKKACGKDIIIQISTGGAIGDTMEDRLKPMSLQPEMATLNAGSLNFGEEVFVNPPPDIERFAIEMKKRQIVPEIEVYSAGMIDAVKALVKKEVLTHTPLHVQFVMGVPGGISGKLKNLLYLKDHLAEEISGATWGVAGVGRSQLPLANMGILLGGHVRVGFEDNIWYKRKVLAKSNGELVARVTRLAEELHRPIATISETREILNLPKGEDEHCE